MDVDPVRLEHRPPCELAGCTQPARWAVRRRLSPCDSEVRLACERHVHAQLAELAEVPA